MSMDLKAVSAKSCEHDSNFYDYKQFLRLAYMTVEFCVQHFYFHTKV